MRDLLQHRPRLTVDEVQLLKVGRHFRLSPSAKAVVGRNEEENAHLERLARPGDTLLELSAVPGPLTVLRGDGSRRELELSGAITARYSRARDRGSVAVTVFRAGREPAGELRVAPARDATCRLLMILPDGGRQ